MSSKNTDYLRFLQTAKIAPAKGDLTIAEASDVFTGWLDGDFKNWSTNVPGEDTDEAAVDVYEMTHDGDCQTLFGSLGNPRLLCLTQGQIKKFCRLHRDLLRQGGYGTFFLFKVKGKLLVAHVRVDASGLRVGMDHFDRDYVWRAVIHLRLVVKQ